MAKSCGVGRTEIEDIIAKFPGPITLLASRLKWWLMIVLSSAMTAAGIFLLSFFYLHPTRVNDDIRLGVGVSVLCTLFFGLCTVFAAIALRRSALRLDENGFQVTALHRRQYRWSEVSDFDVFYCRGTASVVFKTTKPRWSSLGNLNALLTGGRNDGLPDTYGFGASELMQLMRTWQSSAMRAIDST
jgi:hypothetical protein